MAIAILESKPQTEPTPAPAPSPAAFYHPELDGLRFFAFLAVFVYHVFPAEPPKTLPVSPVTAEILLGIISFLKAGQLGVDLFFVLSAYLITELLIREWNEQGEINVGAFYMRRALRIWPLYWGFLIFVVCCEPALGSGSLAWSYAIPMALFLGNWPFVWFAAPPTSSAALLWSVSVEEQFYLAWPWVVRWLTPSRLHWACWGMIAIGCLTRAILVAQGAHHHTIYFNTFVRLDSLGAGALVALWLKGEAPSFSAGWRVGLAALSVAAMVLGMRLLRVDHPPAWGELVTYPLWTLAAVGLLLAVLQPQGSAGGPFLWSPFQYLGRISYGLYVLHFLCIFLVVRLGWGAPFTVANAVSSLVLTITLAALSYQYFEKPFLSLKQRFAVVSSGSN